VSCVFCGGARADGVALARRGEPAARCEEAPHRQQWESDMNASPAHSWRYVLTTFQDRAAANPWFVPMRDFVERLAGSPCANSLYPLLSMHTVHLSQHPEVSWDTERLTIDWEDDAFVVQYQGGPTAPVWTKRHPHGMVALERLFEHLRWFIEYRVAGSRAAG
jgi:hypothetical protein